MPADSEHLPPLPKRYRPLGVRFAVALGSGSLLLVGVVVWIAFGAETRAKFTFFQLATIVVLTGGALLCGYALARSRVDADAQGLTVVNGFKVRRLEWAQVFSFSLRPGAPWVTVNVTDGTSISAMGIQGSDGARAQHDVKELRALARALGAAQEPPRDATH